MSIKEISPRTILEFKKTQYLNINQDDYTKDNPKMIITIIDSDKLIDRIKSTRINMDIDKLIFQIDINLNSLPDMFTKEIRLSDVIQNGYELNLKDILNSSDLIYFGSTPKYKFQIFDEVNKNIIVNWDNINVAKYIDPMTGETYDHEPLFKIYSDNNLKILWNIRMNNENYPEILLNTNENVKLERKNPEGHKAIRDTFAFMTTKECLFKLFTQGDGAGEDINNEVYVFLKIHGISNEMIDNATRNFEQNEISMEHIRNVEILIDELFKSEKISKAANSRINNFYKTLQEQK